MIKTCQSQIGSLNLAQCDILAGTRSMNCLVCGRNEVGNVILNNRVKSQTAQSRQGAGNNFSPTDNNLNVGSGGQKINQFFSDDLNTEGGSLLNSPTTKVSIRRISGGIFSPSNSRSQTARATLSKNKITIKNKTASSPLQPLKFGKIQNIQSNSNKKTTQSDYKQIHNMQSARESITNSLNEAGKKVQQTEKMDGVQATETDLNYTPRMPTLDMPKLSVFRNQSQKQIKMDTRDQANAMTQQDIQRKYHFPYPGQVEGRRHVSTKSLAANKSDDKMFSLSKEQDIFSSYPPPQPGMSQQFVRTTFNQKFTKRQKLGGKQEGIKVAMRPKPH